MIGDIIMIGFKFRLHPMSMLGIQLYKAKLEAVLTSRCLEHVLSHGSMHLHYTRHYGIMALVLMGEPVQHPCFCSLPPKEIGDPARD